jgi:hypothetical protein
MSDGPRTGLLTRWREAGDTQRSMAIREFTDNAGQSWTVWEVQPKSIERRLADHPEVVAVVGERRQRSSVQPRLRMSPHLARGWLTFESRHERRRLIPAPAGWTELSSEQLARLLDRATPTHRRGRLIE